MRNQAIFDMIAIGDTTQDVFLEMTQAKVVCEGEGENCQLCFNYADKIPVDKKTDVPAVGNGANHAIGIARLGLRSAIYTVVGDDAQGKLSIEVFRQNKVDDRYVALDPVHPTNFSCVINYQAERTIFIYHEPRDYDLPNFDTTSWAYLTSVSGNGVHKLHAQVVDWLNREKSVKLAFNPGTHQMNLGLTALKPLLNRTEVLFLNREESAQLLKSKNREIKALMEGFHALGVKIMVLTDGPNGSYASDGKNIWHLGIFDGPVIERTGAGDAFGVGFMGAIMNGRDAAEAMLWGNAESTSVVQHIGAREGLLSIDKVKAVIQDNEAVKPEKYGNW